MCSVQTAQTYLQDPGLDPQIVLAVHPHPLPHLDLPAGSEHLACGSRSLFSNAELVQLKGSDNPV